MSFFINMCNGMHNEIRKISIRVKEWILKQPNVKEESLTDWLLFEMSEKMHNVKYLAFSRNEEAKTTGADWEWWLLLPNNNYYKMRVQAKKIKKNNYKGINYKKGQQIKKLLQDALNTNSIPLYAFYSSISTTHNAFCSYITGNINITHMTNINDEGVFIAGANKIYKSFISGGIKRIKPNDLINISVVLSCFFCCQLIKDDNSLDNFITKYYELENIKDIRETIRKFGGETYEDKDTENLLLGIHGSLPPYVLNLIENKDKDLSYYEKEFERDIKGIDALLVCDFSNPPILANFPAN